jgi:hypothetical protein
MKEQREEIFNFRNKECQQIFKKHTTDTSKLSKAFLNDLPLQMQSKEWEKNLNSFFHQSFRKIRLTKKPKKNHISELLDRRNYLKKDLNRLKKEGEENEAIDDELSDTENNIAGECAEANRKLVMDNCHTRPYLGISA